MRSNLDLHASSAAAETAPRGTVHALKARSRRAPQTSPRAQARRHRALLRHPRPRRGLARAGRRARHHRLAQAAEGDRLPPGRLVRHAGLSLARAGPQTPDRGPQAHQPRLRRAVLLDAQRRPARGAAAAGARAQRDLQYRHAAQWRGDLSRPRRGRALAAAPALHLRLARAAALQRNRQAVPGAGGGRAPAAPAGSLELRRFTETTITEQAKLEAELRQIRKEQVSFDREEYLLGVVCMAVPVIGTNGEMLAALAIQAPEARMNVDTRAAICRRCARRRANSPEFSIQS